MGLLVAGKWCDEWYDTEKTQGKFVREPSNFHQVIGSKDFPAEKDRYHLYVSYACPWAHRALIFRKLKKLEDVISYSTVDARMLKHGWEFRQGETQDPLYHLDYLYKIYLQANPKHTGRVTVPVLWDKKTRTIVNNESAEIIRMLNSAFNEFTDVRTDYYPKDLHTEIDSINRLVYDGVNNGVYRVGFATTQQAYDAAYAELFTVLDKLEERLGRQRYLIDSVLTEADWRLFTTLLRFDVVYYSHFKCNKKRIVDYPNLWGYLRDLYQHPGIVDTVRFDHIKTHYFYSHTMINPTQIVPKGPEIDFMMPHGRA